MVAFVQERCDEGDCLCQFEAGAAFLKLAHKRMYDQILTVINFDFKVSSDRIEQYLTDNNCEQSGMSSIYDLLRYGYYYNDRGNGTLNESKGKKDNIELTESVCDQKYKFIEERVIICVMKKFMSKLSTEGNHEENSGDGRNIGGDVSENQRGYYICSPKANCYALVIGGKCSAKRDEVRKILCECNMKAYQEIIKEPQFKDGLPECLHKADKEGKKRGLFGLDGDYCKLDKFESCDLEFGNGNQSLRTSEDFNSTTYCGNVSYNIKVNACCNGQLSQLPSNSSDWSCCETKPYSNREHACCGGKLSTLLPGQDMFYQWSSTFGCCGTQPYNMATSDCCYKTTYDKKTQHCCSGKAVQLASGLNSGNQWNAKCCGNTSYNTEIQVCCQGEMMELSQADIRKCCPGYVDYIGDTYQCCNGNVTTFPKNISFSSCCGSMTYNIEKYECCNEKLNNLEDNDIDSFWKARCCGSEVYNNEKYKCCNKAIMDKSLGCCGNGTAFNKTTPTCCYSTVVPLAVALTSSEDRDSRCNISFNARTTACCGNDISPLAAGLTSTFDWDAYCCGNVSFNRKVHTCCSSQLSSLPAGVTERKKAACCGAQSYNIHTHGCCNNTIYHIKFHQCCQGKVVPLDKGLNSSNDWNAHCCREKSYNMKNDLCCKGEVVEISEADGESCCSKEIEFAMGERHACCKGNITVFPENVWLRACCGSVGYSLAQYICCNEKLIKLEEGQYPWDMACCASTGYHIETHDCCNNSVYNTMVNQCCQDKIVPLAKGADTRRCF